MSSNPLELIASTQVEGETLTAVIQSLGQPVETAAFWTKIANSTEYSPDHRRRAIYALFSRFISAGITLADLGKILDWPTWLHDEDIGIVAHLGGKLPVRFSPEDTVVVLVVFPDVPDGIYQSWAVYFVVSGKVDRTSVSALLRGDQSTTPTASAKILEIGFSPPNPFRLQ